MAEAASRRIAKWTGFMAEATKRLVSKPERHAETAHKAGRRTESSSSVVP